MKTEGRIRKESRKETSDGRPRRRRRKAVGRLKPERVQDGVAVRSRPRRLLDRLRALPGWTVTRSGRAIGRVRRFSDPGGAAAYAGYATRMAAGTRQTLGITVSSLEVCVTVGSRHGITGAVLDLAAELG